MSTASNPKRRPYRVFISYRHIDIFRPRTWREAVATLFLGNLTWGQWLHRRLERYRVPKDALEHPGAAVDRSLFPCFLDDVEFPSSSSLSDAVEAALDQSLALVVICSPLAATSVWVNREVEIYRSSHPDRPIIAWVIDGSVRAQDPSSQCLPPALRGVQFGGPRGPFVVDAREGAHATSIPAVVALALGGETERFEQAHRLRRRRQTAAGWAAAALVLAAGTMAWQGQWRLGLLRADRLQAERLEQQGLQAWRNADARTALERFDRAQALAPSPKLKFLIARALEAPRLARKLIGHSGRVTAAAFSSDGSRIATASDEPGDQTARVWDARSGEQLLAVSLGAGYGSLKLAVSFTGLLAAGRNDRSVTIWNADGKEQLIVPGKSDLADLVFSRDGMRIAIARGDGTIECWTTTGERSWVTAPLRDGRQRLQFSPDGRSLFVIGNHRLRRLDTASGESELDKQLDFQPLAITADGQGVLGGNPLRVQSLATGAYTAEMTGSAIAAMSPDGQRVVIDSSLWHIASRTLLGSYHKEMQATFAFSPDGKHLLAAGTNGRAEVWTAPEISPVRAVEARTIVAGPLKSAHLSNDGRRVVTTSPGDSARIWDASSGGLIASLRAPPGEVQAARFTAGGDIATSGRGNTIRIWDHDGKPIRVIDGTQNPVDLVPAGDNVVAGVGERWFIVDLEHEAAPAEITSSLPPRASRRGDTLLTIRDSTAFLDDLSYQRASKQVDLSAAGMLQAVDLSSNGSRLLTYGDDGWARIWDTDSGTVVASTRDEIVSEVVLSPDGTWAVIGSPSGPIRLWRPTPKGDGKLIELEESNGELLAISDDGSVIAALGEYGDLAVWSAEGKLRSKIGLEPYDNRIVDLSMSGDGSVVLAAGRKGFNAWRWKESQTTVVPFPDTSDTKVAAKFSFDRKKAFASRWNTSPVILDTESSSEPVTLAYQPFLHPDSLAASSDGSRVVAITGNGARVWDATTGRIVARPVGPQHPTRAWVSDDGQIVLVNAHPHELWDAKEGLRIRSLERTFSDIVLSPNGRTVATVDDGSPVLTNVRSGQSRRLPVDASSVGPFSRDSTLLAARVVGECATELWDIDRDRKVLSLPTCEEPPVFFSDGKLVAAHALGTVKVWDLSTGRLQSEFDLGDLRWKADAMSLEQDLAVIEEEQSLDFWQLSTQKRIGGRSRDRGLEDFVLSPSGDRLVLRYPTRLKITNTKQPGLEHSVYGSFSAVELSSNSEWLAAVGDGAISIRSPDKITSTLTIRTSEDLRSVAISPTGDQIIAVDDHGGMARWSVAGEPSVDPSDRFKGLSTNMLRAELSPDGKSLLTVEDDRAVLWNETQPLYPVPGGTKFEATPSIAFSADSAWLAISSSDGSTYLSNTRTRSPVLTLRGQRGAARDPAFSGNGKRLAVVDADGVQVWSIPDGTLIGSLGERFGSAMTHPAWTSDGALLATTVSNGIQIWDGNDASLLVELKLNGGIANIAFAPDDRALNLVRDDGSLWQWQLSGRERSAEELHRLVGEVLAQH